MPTRVRSQLAIQASPELLERLRAAAAAQRRTVTSLLTEWIELGLSGALVAPTAAAAGAGVDLQARVEALEKAMAQLQDRSPTTASRTPKPRPAAAPRVERLGDGLLEIKGSTHPQPVAEPPASGITTAELAERTGTNRAAWNNWARDKRPGAVRKMPPEVGQWRLAGKAPAPGGGPERWLWEPA